MPMILNISQKQLGPFLKLQCIVNIMGEENKDLSKEFNVNDLAVVRLTFFIKDSLSELETYISANNHEKAKNDKVMLKVSSQDFDDPCYLKWICQNNKDIIIGKKLHCDASMNDVRICIINIIISASKAENDFLVKLYNDMDFTDFHLVAENGRVAVHRAYLAAHSEVFKAMLSHEWKEATEYNVQVKNITLQTLQDLKKYLYLKIVPKHGLQPLLLVAAHYEIEDLKEKCISTIAQTTKDEDWFRLFKFATENNIPELVCAVTLANPGSALSYTESKPLKQISEIQSDDSSSSC